MTRRASRFQNTQAVWVASILFGLVFISAFAHATNSASDQQTERSLKSLTLEQLGNIEVTTTSKEPEQVWKTAAAIYVITQQAIQRSGVRTLPDALRLAPGVEVAQIDSNKWSVGIRGFGSRLSRDVLVMIDGRTVYNTLLAGTYWEVQNVLLADVDRIEVIRGPGATIWGPNALNGVINIITKTSKDTHGTLVEAGGGSVEEGFLNARYGGSYGNDLNYRVYGLTFDRGPEYHADHDNYDSWRALQGGFRTDFSPNTRDILTVEGDMYREGAGETVTATTYAPPYSQILRGTEFLSGGNILARWSRTQGPGKDFQVQAFYDRTDRREPNFADYRNTFDIDFLDRFRLPGREQISWGLGARASTGTNPTIVSGLSFSPRTRTDTLYTGFVQNEIEAVHNQLYISLGTKLIKTNYTGVDAEPSARLLWTPTKQQTVWAAFTRALRTPSDAERAFYLLGLVGVESNGTPFFARFNPNPDFKSEDLDGYEIGYRKLFRQTVYLDISTFLNHYSDLFSEDIIGPPYVETNPQPTHILLPADFGNGLVGTTKGVEFAPEWQVLKFWRLGAAYSFLEMQLKKGPNSMDVGTAPVVEGSSPRHQLTAESDFTMTKAFTFDLTLRYVSALPKLSINPYTTGDARFAWHWKNGFEFAVVGRNLLQPYHFEYPSDPGPNVGIKRSVYGQFTWQR